MTVQSGFNRTGAGGIGSNLIEDYSNINWANVDRLLRPKISENDLELRENQDLPKIAFEEVSNSIMEQMMIRLSEENSIDVAIGQFPSIYAYGNEGQYFKSAVGCCQYTIYDTEGQPCGERQHYIAKIVHSFAEIILFTTHTSGINVRVHHSDLIDQVNSALAPNLDSGPIGNPYMILDKFAYLSARTALEGLRVRAQQRSGRNSSKAVITKLFVLSVGMGSVGAAIMFGAPIVLASVSAPLMKVALQSVASDIIKIYKQRERKWVVRNMSIRWLLSPGINCDQFKSVVWYFLPLKYLSCLRYVETVANTSDDEVQRGAAHSILADFPTKYQDIEELAVDQERSRGTIFEKYEPDPLVFDEKVGGGLLAYVRKNRENAIAYCQSLCDIALSTNDRELLDLVVNGFGAAVENGKEMIGIIQLAELRPYAEGWFNKFAKLLSGKYSNSSEVSSIRFHEVRALALQTLEKLMDSPDINLDRLREIIIRESNPRLKIIKERILVNLDGRGTNFSIEDRVRIIDDRIRELENQYTLNKRYAGEGLADALDQIKFVSAKRDVLGEIRSQIRYLTEEIRNLTENDGMAVNEDGILIL